MRLLLNGLVFLFVFANVAFGSNSTRNARDKTSPVRSGVPVAASPASPNDQRPDEPDCAGAAAAVARLTDEQAASLGRSGTTLVAKGVELITKICIEDKWSAAMTACLMRAPNDEEKVRCNAMLTAAQKKRLDEGMRKLFRDGMGSMMARPATEPASRSLRCTVMLEKLAAARERHGLTDAERITDRRLDTAIGSECERWPQPAIDCVVKQLDSHADVRSCLPQHLSAEQREALSAAVELVLGVSVASARIASLCGSRVVPGTRDGQMIGLKVYGVKPTGWMANRGLQNGDTITAVDTQPLNDLKTTAAVMVQLCSSQATPQPLHIVRRGKPLTLPAVP